VSPVHSLKTCLAVTVTALLGLAACDDDDDDAATDPAPADAEPADDSGSDDVAAYCEASLAFETVPDPEIDFETASEEEVVTGLKAYAVDVLQPAMADIVATAPDELADEADRFSAIVDDIAATGDGSLFESPEAAEISATAHAYDMVNCGWESVDVTATNYAFAGIPAELPAGVTSFNLGNEGEDLHELVLVRKNDGVTQSAEELLALPEEEAMSLTTMVGTNAFAAPGEEDYTIADLEPGDYVALCFVPVGATSTDGPPPDGPPHAMEGMYAEFTVS
jgi:hypothetical protein